MPITTRFDEATGILRFEVSGAMREDLIFADLDRLYSEGGALRFQRRLWDIRRSTDQFSTEAIQRISARVVELTGNADYGWAALLVETDLQWGMLRTMLPRVEGGSVKFKLFRDEAEAVTWLQSVGKADAAGA